MNLTDGCVTKTLDYQPDYAENNTIEWNRGIVTGGGDGGFKYGPQTTTPTPLPHPHTAPAEDNATRSNKITLVKLNSENEFNIKWVTARQSVIGLQPLSGAACMAYELIRHLWLH